MARRAKINIAEGVIDVRKKVLSEANAELRTKLEWILDWQASEISRSLLGRWELGREIDEVWHDLKENRGKRFGKSSKKAIATFLKEDPSIVNVAHKIFNTYPDKKRLVEITEMVMQDGVTHLSYSHIRQLLAVEDEQKRHELMNECLEKCWTSAELGAAVQRQNGGKKTHNPKGRAAIPKDVNTVIGQMISFADDFDNRNAKVWKSKDFSVPAQIDKMNPYEITEELTEQVGVLAHRMRQLADEATARAVEAERKHTYMLDMLKKERDNAKKLKLVAN